MCPQKDHVGHPVDDNDAALLELQNKLKRRAETEEMSLKDIFNDETRNSPVAEKISFPEVESTMYKRRKKTQPVIPVDLRELPEVLNENLLLQINGSPFFRGMVDAGDDGIGFLFASDFQMEILGMSESIGIDGTFKTVPRQFYQMYSIFSTVGGHTFPTMFAFLTRKTEGLYLALFEKVKEINPLFEPRRVMADFEQAPINALTDIFPNIETMGCWFHFVNAVIKKLRKVGLTDEYTTNPVIRGVLKSLMCLPLLPAEEIEASFILLKDSLSPGDRRRLRPLLRYMRRFWLNQIGPERMSVYGSRERTNNGSESFHASLKRQVGVHPSLFNHLPKLKRIAENVAHEIGRVRNGLPIRRKQKSEVVTNNKRIANCVAKLDAGTYTPIQFLGAVSHSLDSYVNFEDPDESSDESDSSESEDESDHSEGDNDPDNNDEINISRDTNDTVDFMLRDEIDLDIEDNNILQGEFDNVDNDEIIHNDEPENQVEDDPNLMCNVCLIRHRDAIALVPCGHSTFCNTCIDTLMALRVDNATCPVCRTPIQMKINVFQ